MVLNDNKMKNPSYQHNNLYALYNTIGLFLICFNHGSYQSDKNTLHLVQNIQGLSVIHKKTTFIL